MPTMRAKVTCRQVVANEYDQEQVTFTPVSKSGSYPSDGMDEDNTYAKFSPSGKFELTIANPDLIGKIKPGQTFYVDFTLVPKKE